MSFKSRMLNFLTAERSPGRTLVFYVLAILVSLTPILAFRSPRPAKPSCIVHWPIAPASLGENAGSTLQRSTLQRSALPGIPSRVYMSEDGLLHIVFMGPDPLLGRDAAGNSAGSAAIPGGSVDPATDDSQPLEHCSLPPPRIWA